MRPNRRDLLTFVVAGLVLASVATAQPQTPAATPAASPDSAQLVVFNDSGKTLVPSNQKVTDNGRPLTSLPRQSYVTLTLPPGTHRLRPDPYLWKQEVVLELQPGTTRFVVVAYKPERSWVMPVAGAPLLLKEISADEAAPLLTAMKPLKATHD